MARRWIDGVSGAALGARIIGVRQPISGGSRRVEALYTGHMAIFQRGPGGSVVVARVFGCRDGRWAAVGGDRPDTAVVEAVAQLLSRGISAGVTDLWDYLRDSLEAAVGPAYQCSALHVGAAYDWELDHATAPIYEFTRDSNIREFRKELDAFRKQFDERAL